MDFIEAIEEALGKTARKNFLPLQDGDVPATYADVSRAGSLDRLHAGHAGARGRRAASCDWYRGYYQGLSAPQGTF